MKPKSKFVTFIASCIPGLSHLYLGFADRALLFFSLFALSIAGVMGLFWVTGVHEFFVILLIALPIIWFVGLVDSLSLVDKLRREGVEGPQGNNYDFINLALNNRKVLTVVFSIVPGAGHMYLGLLNEGIQLMALFFFTAFLMGWLNLSILVFILPVIWFYSMFDAYHRVETGNDYRVYGEVPFFNWINKHPRWIGWGLIVFGALILFERIVSPLISWEIRNYLQTGIVSLIFIAGGVKLLAGNKVNKKSIATEPDNTDNIEESEVNTECDNGE
ncbi:MAG: hypothetical protein PHR65_06140 [Syntrophomonadaceae bacterium]|nr:hypothetical protein [Syntrophomonadaceae bacterium]